MSQHAQVAQFTKLGSHFEKQNNPMLAIPIGKHDSAVSRPRMPSPGVPRPKVLVAAHECSGGQFVSDALALNFGYAHVCTHELSDGPMPVSQAPQSDDSIVAHLPGHWVVDLFESHYEHGFYADWLRNYGADLRIIYVVRDVLPTLRSYQSFLWNVDPSVGPQVQMASQFIHTPPSGNMLRFQHRTAETMVHRWANHVQGWLEGGSRLGRHAFLLLHYDALFESFEATVHELANFLQLPVTNKIQQPLPENSAVRESLVSPSVDERLSDADHAFVVQITAEVYRALADRSRYTVRQ